MCSSDLTLESVSPSLKLFCKENRVYTVGRGDKNDLAINNLFISTVHCHILREDRLVYLIDTSSNGTFLGCDQQVLRLERNVKRLLNTGDKVILIPEGAREGVPGLSFTFIQEHPEIPALESYSLGRNIGRYIRPLSSSLACLLTPGEAEPSPVFTLAPTNSP